LCTKSFNYEKLMLEEIRHKRDVNLEEVGRVDVMRGKLIVQDKSGETILEEPIRDFHDAALKGCDECADFMGHVRTFETTTPPEPGERPRVDSLCQDKRLVFPTTTGTTIRCTNLLGRHVKPLLKRAGLPAIRLHDLQHTYATILLMAGKHPKYVQELLGHASINITLDPSFQRHRGDGRRARRLYGRAP
jgi:hypothetical protein